MAFGDIIQRAEASNDNASSLTLAYGATPTPGNLLVAVQMTGATSCDLVASGGNNWTSAIHWQNATELDAARLWWRIAAASEATSVVATPSATDENGLLLLEIEGPWESAPVDQTTDPGRQALGGSTYSVGTSGTTTQANEVAVAAVYTRNATNNGTSWTQTFVAHAGSTVSSTNKSISAATKLLTATGTVETTYTLTTAAVAQGGLVTFKKQAGGPTPITGSDSLALRLVEGAAIRTSLARNDSMVQGVAESLQLRANLQREDTLQLSITELAGLLAAISGADIVQLVVNDAIANIVANTTSGDGIVCGIAEDRVLVIRLTREDLVGISCIDTQSVLASLAIGEGIPLLFLESGSVVDLTSGLTTVSGSDGLLLGLSDTAVNILARIATDDIIAAVWIESLTILGKLNRDDAAIIGLSDTGTVAIAISSAGDSLSIGLTDSTANTSILIAGTDAVACIASEVSQLLVRLNADDAFTIDWQDTLDVILAILSRADIPAVIVVDNVQIQVPVSGADAVIIGLTEQGVAIEVTLNRLGSILLATVKSLIPLRSVRYLGGPHTVEVL